MAKLINGKLKLEENIYGVTVHDNTVDYTETNGQEVQIPISTILHFYDLVKYTKITKHKGTEKDWKRFCKSKFVKKGN